MYLHPNHPKHDPSQRPASPLSGKANHAVSLSSGTHQNGRTKSGPVASLLAPEPSLEALAPVRTSSEPPSTGQQPASDCATKPGPAAPRAAASKILCTSPQQHSGRPSALAPQPPLPPQPQGAAQPAKPISFAAAARIAAASGPQPQGAAAAPSPKAPQQQQPSQSTASPKSATRAGAGPGPFSYRHAVAAPSAGGAPAAGMKKSASSSALAPPEARGSGPKLNPEGRSGQRRASGADGPSRPATVGPAPSSASSRRAGGDVAHPPSRADPPVSSDEVVNAATAAASAAVRTLPHSPPGMTPAAASHCSSDDGSSGSSGITATLLAAASSGSVRAPAWDGRLRAPQVIATVSSQQVQPGSAGSTAADGGSTNRTRSHSSSGPGPQFQPSGRAGSVGEGLSDGPYHRGERGPSRTHSPALGGGRGPNRTHSPGLLARGGGPGSRAAGPRDAPAGFGQPGHIVTDLERFLMQVRRGNGGDEVILLSNGQRGVIILFLHNASLFCQPDAPDDEW